MAGGASGPRTQADPVKNQVSVAGARPDPPNSTSLWRASSYTICAPLRGWRSAGAAGPWVHATPSQSHVSFTYGGHTPLPSAARASPPNSTSSLMSGSKAMAAPPRGVNPAGAGGPSIHWPPVNNHVSFCHVVTLSTGAPPNTTTWSRGGKYAAEKFHRGESPAGSVGPAENPTGGVGSAARDRS